MLSERVYEGLFLFESNKYSRNPKEVSGQVNQAIEKCGGEVLVSRLWAEQKLAYPINGQRTGTYWLAHFRMDSLRREELNRAFRLNTNLLRELVLIVDERLVDALVKHASGAVTDKAPKPNASTDKSKDDKSKVGADDDLKTEKAAAGEAAKAE